MKVADIKESSNLMLIPLIFLSLGAVFAGYFFKDIFISSNNYLFWKNSILFLNKTENHSAPLWLLILTPLIVLTTIPFTYYIFIKNKKILTSLISKQEPEIYLVYKFLLNKWYFDELYEFIFVKPIKKIGLFFWKEGDINTIDRFGPDGFSRFVKLISEKTSEFQSGYLYHYAFVMLIGFSLMLTYLILN